MPLIAPMTMPTASAMASDTGNDSQAGVQFEAAAGAAGAEGERHHHRGERHHRFDREIHVAGDQRQRQADGDDADEGRLLEDVEEDADLQEVRDRRREDRSDHDQDEPDQVVEDELDHRAAARGPGFGAVACRRCRSWAADFAAWPGYGGRGEARGRSAPRR